MADHDLIQPQDRPADPPNRAACETTIEQTDTKALTGGPEYGTIPSGTDADTLPTHHNISCGHHACVAAGADDDILNTRGHAAVICFASGTHIMTDRGDRQVQSLSIGDNVITRDHGMQKIRWVGSRKTAAKGDMAPIVLTKGSFNNTRDLVVSPWHRMLFVGDQAELMFGQAEVLVSAKHLLNNDRVYRVVDGLVEYFHVLFDRHEIIYAEGAASESYHPGGDNLAALAAAPRDQIFRIFPELRALPNSYGPMSRTCLKPHEGRLLKL